MGNTYQNKKILISLVLAVLLCCTLLFPIQSSGIAFASERTFSNVLTDLKKSDDFNPDDYPVIDNDYSLKVIQIAESNDKELLVYVYQPSADVGDITATTLSMSIVNGKNLSPVLYELELLNYNGVFYKYRVKDFTIPSTDTRIYSVISIYRPFIKGIDEEPGHDNTVSEVAFKVAKEYTFYSGSNSYQMEVLDVVEITDKFVGFLRFSGENRIAPDPVWGSFKSSFYVQKDGHFVAFSTNKDIDKLLEADIFYVSQSWGEKWEYDLFSPETDYYHKSYHWGQHEEKMVTITSDQRLAYTTGALWWKEDKLVNRIQTVAEFVSSVEDETLILSGALLDVTTGSILTDDTKNALVDKQWVIRFADTEYWSYMDPSRDDDYSWSGKNVGDVSILRLKFVTDGRFYNLGVVDNKQTGSSNPVNEYWYDLDFHLPDVGDGWSLDDILAVIFLCLLAVGLLVILAPILPYVFQCIVAVFRGIGKIFAWSGRNTAKSIRNVTALSVAKSKAKKSKIKQQQKKLKKELKKKHQK